MKVLEKGKRKENQSISFFKKFVTFSSKMNYDFLQSYNMPRQSSDQYASSSYSTMEGAYGSYSMQPIDSTPTVDTSYYGYGGTSAYSEGYPSYEEKLSSSVVARSARETYQYTERFVSSKGTGYIPSRSPYKRKYSGIDGGGSAAKKENIVEVTSDGKMVMFLGRDDGYPDELNALIHPLSCDICKVKMNSRVSAKDHYESKIHDKGLSSWLVKNYTEKGLSPPSLKRFVKQGPSGPDAFHCEACDLKLTSLAHANQHYAGKKHRLVIAQRAKPSGAGYYNSEGKWVRTGTKLKSNKDRRFGIGEAFKYGELLVTTDKGQKSPSNTTTSLADTTTNIGDLKTNKESNKTALVSTADQDPSLFCSICKLSVTSAVQLTMHLSGSKHMKKLKLSGIDPTSIVSNAESQSVAVQEAPIIDNVLLSAIKEEVTPDLGDLSMHRTPSGQYYCKTCNTSISHLPGLEQHLRGKRHLKKLTEERAVAALCTNKQ